MLVKTGVVCEGYKHHQDYLFPDCSKTGASLNEAFKTKSIELVSGRRDWAAFQIILQSDEKINVEVGKRAVFSINGPIRNIRLDAKLDGFESENIAMKIIGLVTDDDTIKKADMLLEQDSILVEENLVQCVWVEVKIPEDTKPGSYIGKINIFTNKMFEDEELVDTLNFKLQVKDFVLPEPKDYSFYLDLWQHNSNIARKHEVKLWSNEHFCVMESYIKSLSELGQKAISVIVSEIPWSGQSAQKVPTYYSDFFEYSIVNIYKNINGSYEYDFSNLKRYIELCMKYGINKEIEVFGLVSIWKIPEMGYDRIIEDYKDAIRLRYLDLKDGSYKYIRDINGLKEYVSALENFFIKEKWQDLVRVVADEPADKEVYNAALSMLKEVAPSFKYKTAINNVDFIAESKDKIEDFIPCIDVASKKWDELEKMRGLIKGKLMYYVCCGPQYPNTFIASPLVESRLIGIIASYFNLDGFLRWNYTAWPEYPRERISYRAPYWKAGDTNFVYPGYNGEPILTLRYKMLKRGIEDFELLEKVKKLEKQDVLQDIWNDIFKERDIRKFYVEGSSPSKLYSLDYNVYENVKNKLLDILIQNKI